MEDIDIFPEENSQSHNKKSAISLVTILEGENSKFKLKLCIQYIHVAESTI